MKKSILTLSIIFSIFCLTLTSCSSDDNDDDAPPATSQKELTGSFEIYIDGVLYKEGTNANVGRIKDDQGNYVNTVTIAIENDVNITVSGFPKTISDNSIMEADSDPGVTILSGSDFYSTNSGTFTRTSGSKISFTGTCSKILETTKYSITGYVESEAWEVIN